MSLTLVLPDAASAAARVGGLVAEALARSEDVRVVLRDDGPLVPWLEARVGATRLTLCHPSAFPYDAPFEARVEAARGLLRGDPADTVYVASLAASDFAAAARADGRFLLLHVHEDEAESAALVQRDLARIELAAGADAVLLAHAGLLRPLVARLGALPKRLLEFGIGVDLPSLRREAEAEPAMALNAAGEKLSWGKRQLIGCIGDPPADPERDLLWQLAPGFPRLDFVRIASDAPALEDRAAVWSPRNLHLARVEGDGFAEIARLDALVLDETASADPYRVAGALALGVAAIGFAGTPSERLLGRHGILLHGSSGLSAVERSLAAIAEALPEDRQGPDDGLDIAPRVAAVEALIAELRSTGGPAG
jgi:hypothetical protein